MDRSHADIPAFWEHVMGTEALAGLGDLSVIYAVYMDYESDFTGAYTMLIGVKCDENLVAPEGMRRVDIPAQTWAVTKTADAEPETILKAWSYIWTDWEEREKRTHELDLEIYRFGREPGVELQLGMDYENK